MKQQMKLGPSLAPIAALAGDPARANMLAALLSGSALTAGELANEAVVGAATASAHLAKLEQGGLVVVARQGRHRYFRLAGSDVCDMLESMMGVAARAGFTRTRPGPADPALRRARVCYDHLAGEMGVALFDSLLKRRMIADGPALALTRKGQSFAQELGIDLAMLGRGRRPLCRACLDWSERRRHLAGALGAALLARMLEQKWAARRGRVLRFSPAGERGFRALLGD
jgi:DNA-binding transcriptional ArsR family regulator